MLRGLKSRLYLASVYLVTDARQGFGDLAEATSEALAAGGDLVHLVDTSMAGDDEAAVLSSLLDVTRRHPDSLLVATDVAAAVTAGVDVVCAAGSVPTMREQLHRHALVGCVVDTAENLAETLAGNEPDFLVVGPAAVASALERARPGEVDSLPWFGYGAPVEELVAAGARRVVVDLRGVADVTAAVTAAADLMRSAWQEDPRFVDYPHRISQRVGL